MTDRDRQKIIARIAALLALATNNDNAHEAESAMEKAKGLMQEYRVSEMDVQDARDQGGIGEEYIRTTTTRIPGWKKILAARLPPLLNCSAIASDRYTNGTGRVVILIVGNEIDRLFCVHLLESLFVQIERIGQEKRKQWRKSKRKRTRLESYRQGVAFGVLARVRQLMRATDGMSGLVRVGDLKKIDEWIERKYEIEKGQIKTKPNRDFVAGLHDSKRLTVARAVSSAKMCEPLGLNPTTNKE